MGKDVEKSHFFHYHSISSNIYEYERYQTDAYLYTGWQIKKCNCIIGQMSEEQLSIYSITLTLGSMSTRFD